MTTNIECVVVRLAEDARSAKLCSGAPVNSFTKMEALFDDYIAFVEFLMVIETQLTIDLEDTVIGSMGDYGNVTIRQIVDAITEVLDEKDEDAILTVGRPVSLKKFWPHNVTVRHIRLTSEEWAEAELHAQSALLLIEADSNNVELMEPYNKSEDADSYTHFLLERI